MAVARACAVAVALLFASIASVPASAQTVTDGRAWTGLSLQERPDTPSPWRWAVDSLLRTRDGVAEVDVVGVRGTLGHDLTSRSSLWAGYAVASSFPTSGGTTIEHRIFQQYLWNGRAAGGAVTLRTRLEQRRIEGNSGVLWRFRQQVRYSRPVRQGSRFALVGSEEIFLHGNETSKYDRGLDQNRAFAGFGRTVSASVRVEAGYLNQFSHSRSGPDRLNHILSVGASVTY